MEKKDLTQTRQYYGFLSLLLVLFALIPNVINAQGSSPITLAGGSVDIDGSTITQPVVLTGSTTDAEFVPLTIKGGSEDKPVEVTLQGVTLSVKQDDYWGDDKRFAGIVIDENSYVRLIIDGENYVRGGRNCAGIYVSNTATLVIYAANDNAKLTSIGGCKDGGSSHGGGAGIGANVDCQYGNIIINGGIIYAEGCKGGAGIGGSWGGQDGTPGKITINGGNVTAKGSTGLSGYFCTDGIGSIRTPATVEINGGFINASVKEGSTVVSTTKIVYKSYSGLTPGQEVDVYCWDNVNSVKTKVSEDGTLSFLAANNVNVFGDKKLIQTGVSDAGHASITPGGIYAVGDKVTLTVSVNDQQYAMTGWEDDKSNSNLTREITVGDEDATYKANIAYLYGDVPACVNNEYQIYNVNQLKWFRDLVNGTLTGETERKKDANAKLMADIDLQYEVWTPIGKYSPWGDGVENVYAGTFDGNNHTISNLKVEKVYCCGFFGSVAGGHVMNLGIINADLNCSEGLIGVIAGTISHADIKNCYAVGDLKLNASGKCETAAGIANYGEWSNIKNSYTSYSKVFDATNINNAGTENCQAGIASSAHLTGELAYLLNSHKQDGEAGWGQAIGTDAHPVALTADNVVYKHDIAAEASTISLGTDFEDRITTLCYPADVVLPNKVKAFTISSLEGTGSWGFARMDELKSDVIAANSPVVLMNTGGEAATLNLPAVSGYYSNNETASDIISQSGNLLKGAYSQMSLDYNKYSWDRSAFEKNHSASTLSAYKCYFESESRMYAYFIATNEPVGEIEYAVLSEEDKTCYVSRLFYAGIGTKDYTVSIPATVQINGKEYEVAQFGTCDDDSDNKSFGNMNFDRNIKFYVNLPKTLKTVSKLVLSNMAYNAAFGCSVCFKFTTEEPPVFKVNSTDPRYYGAELIVPYAAEELYKAAWGDEYVNITSNKTELDIANGDIYVTGNYYTQGENTGTINETLVIKGTSTENNIGVESPGTEDKPLRIAINGLSIDLSNVEYYIPAIRLLDSNVSLIVQGTNTLKKSPLAKGSIELREASLAINKLSTGTLDVSDGIDGDNVEVAAKVYDGLESFSYQNIKAGSTLGTNQLAFGLYAIPGVENFVAGGKCDKFVLSDAVNFYSPEAFTADAVKYKRTFEDNEFNSLYLPFSAKVDDFKNCEFYVINMFHQNDTDNDGVLDNITLEVDKVPAGSTLLPNHPYLFKYTGDNLDAEEVFNLSNIEVSATKTPSFECSSMSYKYEFVGNYQYKASADYADYYVIGVDNTTGKTALVHPTTDLPAMRWAMKMTARESQFGSASLPLPAKMFIHINGEDNTTGISNVATEDSGCEYYGLDGVRKDKMAKGINIVKMKNGRVVKMVRR